MGIPEYCLDKNILILGRKSIKRSCESCCVSRPNDLNVQKFEYPVGVTPSFQPGQEDYSSLWRVFLGTSPLLKSKRFCIKSCYFSAKLVMPLYGDMSGFPFIFTTLALNIVSWLLPLLIIYTISLRGRS